MLRERAREPFSSVDELARRVPELRKNELVTLAEIGALNAFSVPGSQFSEKFAQQVHLRTATREPGTRLHRRDALWQVARAARPSGPLLQEAAAAEPGSPLAPMRAEERLVADFRGTGLSVGPHPMAYRRAKMEALGVQRACDLPRLAGGRRVRVAGCVIARQRPGTARGFVFLSLEDETGIANVILTPDVFDRQRTLLVSEPFLVVEGRLQNQDRVVSVRAERVFSLAVTRAQMRSHDFH